MSQPFPEAGDHDALTAALLQITAHAERLAVVGEREAAHHQEIAARLSALTQLLGDACEQIGAMRDTADRHAALLGALDGLDQEVAALTTRLTELADGSASVSRADGNGERDRDAYQPAPTPRWWKLHGQERDQALARLRAWVEQIYLPSYGHLGAALGPCWGQHPLCLYGLDWLMELWAALYLTGQRTPGTLAEQMHLETTRCHHRQRLQHRTPGRPEDG